MGRVLDIKMKNGSAKMGRTAVTVLRPPGKTGVSQALSYAYEHRAAFVRALMDFIRFPSVSANNSGAVRKCAEWLAGHLNHIGMKRVSITPTKRHPIVYAEYPGSPGQATVLFYGHYDVQPAGGHEAWQTPPFEPVVRGDNLYGRGASDDKGQLFTHIAAIESYLRSSGKLPVNVKCIFEGEEEIGSPSLGPFLTNNRALLLADMAVVSDTSMPGPDTPAITFSLRGALGIDLEVSGPAHDVHSGTFGGAVPNPFHVLCEMIACLHDKKGRIAIPGFYDSVRARGRQVRDYMARTGPSDETILKDAGARAGWGEPGYTLYERTTLRPALSVTRITSGTDTAQETAAIPSIARASLDFRLVPDQAPHKIARIVHDYVQDITPHTVRATIRTRIAAKPAVISPAHPGLKAAAGAYRLGFGKEPLFLLSGGTIPVVRMFKDILGIETVLMGFALFDDGKHGPNEKLYLPNFFNGISTSIHFLSQIGQRRGEKRERGLNGH